MVIFLSGHVSWQEMVQLFSDLCSYIISLFNFLCFLSAYNVVSIYFIELFEEFLSLE